MTSRTIPKTILLGGEPRHAEAPGASGPITPGMLLTLNSSGAVIPHNAAGGKASAMFAREADYMGSDIDTTFADGENVPYWHGRSGDRFFARLATSQIIAKGALLESAAGGSLRAADAASGARATLTIGAANAAVKFDAVQAGIAGNDISIEVLAATAATATVTVVDRKITIKPDSTTGGTTDLASTVVTLVNANAYSQALVVASNPGTGASVIVSPVAEANLAGGADTTGHPIVRAIEAVTTTDAVKRIKVEVI